MRKDSPTVAIWGHYHGGNLGDELVTATIVDAIRRRLPAARIVGISMAPGDTTARHGIESFPIGPGMPSVRPRHAPRTSNAGDQSSARHGVRAVARIPGLRATRRALKKSRRIVAEVPFSYRAYRLLRTVDGVVVAGSGQLLDEWRGPWDHPWTTYRWALLARLARVPMRYPSVGAGPIDGRLSAFFIRSAVGAADFVSVRDANSGRVLESIGLRGPFPYCPDMAYGAPASLVDGPPETPTGGDVVGLNVIAHSDPRYWPRGELSRYEAYLAKMAAFASVLLAQGYTIRVFSSQTRADDLVAHEFLHAVRERTAANEGRLSWIGGEIDEVDDLVRAIRGFDAVVAGRYHSVLLPLLLGVPALGLAYNTKTQELLADVGLPERCLDIDTFTVDDLLAAFTELRATGLTEAVQARVSAHRRAVEEQFDVLFGRQEPSILEGPRLEGQEPTESAPARVRRARS